MDDPHADLSDGDHPSDGSVAASFAELVQAYEGARAAIVTLPDGRKVYEHGTNLATLLLKLRGDAADLRAIGASRIQRQESLTMQEVADRLGVTRQRAQQFVRAGRAADSTTEADSAAISAGRRQ